MDDPQLVWSLSYDVAGVADMQARVAAATQTLGALIPADIVGWAELGVGGGQTTLLTRAGPERAAVTELVAQTAAMHPIGLAMQARPTSGDPVRMTDLIPLSGWRRHAFYNEVFRPIGVTYQLAIPIPPYRPGTVQAWAFSNSAHDFSDAAVRLAAVLQPLLAALHLADKRSSGVNAESAERYRLTAREVQVLELISAGLTARHIAYLLRLSEGTVRKHAEHIYAKLGAHDKVTAVTIARECGAIS